MTKAFLALKGVDSNLCSAWIKHPLLKTQYVLGKRISAPHPSLPFFLANPSEIPNNKARTGCDEEKYILVAVLAKDIVFTNFFLDWDNARYDATGPKTIEDCVKRTSMWRDDNDRIFAKSLRPLEIWDGIPGKGEDGALQKWLKDRARHYKMKILQN